MELQPISDFFSNIKDKLTNPFFGTLIIVWLTRNWELIYTLFNFDKTSKLNTKISFIKTYWENKNFQDDFIASVLQSIIILILGYGIIAITRSLSLVLEFNVMPWLTHRIINKNVVLRTEYNKVTEERDNYFSKYENERNSIRKISDDYDTLQDNYKKNINNYSELSTKFNELNEEHEKSSKIEADNEVLIESLKHEIKSKNKLIEYNKHRDKNLLNLDFNNITTEIINNIVNSDQKFQIHILSSLKNKNIISKTLPSNLNKFIPHFKNLLDLFEWSDLTKSNDNENIKLNNEGINLLKLIEIIIFYKNNKIL